MKLRHVAKPRQLPTSRVHDQSAPSPRVSNVPDIFQSLHGIDISRNGETLFVSGRVDGHLHIIDTETGELFKASSTTTSERKKDDNLYEYFWKQKSTQVDYKLNRKVFE